MAIVTISAEDKANLNPVIESTCSQYNTPSRNLLEEMNQVLKEGGSAKDAIQHSQKELLGELSQAMAMNSAREVAPKLAEQMKQGSHQEIADGSNQHSPNTTNGIDNSTTRTV